MFNYPFQTSGGLNVLNAYLVPSITGGNPNLYVAFGGMVV